MSCTPVRECLGQLPIGRMNQQRSGQTDPNASLSDNAQNIDIHKITERILLKRLSDNEKD